MDSASKMENPSRDHTTGSLDMGHAPVTPASSSAEGGLQVMGRHVQVLQEMIAKLDIGVDADMPLPRLAVIGDQSAGKSSVIGALAEIDLPRDSGTSTRCPYFILTKGARDPNASWSCKVSLQKKYEFLSRWREPKKRGQIGLGPWQRLNETIVDEFMVINDKKDLGDTIKWAQMAILNPEDDFSLYVPGSGQKYFEGADCRSAEFSPNLVAMEITGPGLSAMSFYDLPGIIQNHAEDFVVTVVTNLIREYLANKDTLVLLCLPMTTEPANSTVFRFAREEGALARCLGVLTKPDELSNKTTEFQKLYLPLLNGDPGNLYKLRHGWYITKQPGPLEPVADHEEARANEAQFFECTSPFDDIRREHSERFGTEKLRVAVSLKLTLQIKNALPDIEKKIRTKVSKIQAALENLPPPPPDDVSLQVAQLLAKFSSKVVDEIKGRGIDCNRFQSEWREISREFRQTILAMLPNNIDLELDLNEAISAARASQSEGEKQTEPILIDDDTPAKIQQRTPSSKRTLKQEPGTPLPANKKIKATESQSQTPRRAGKKEKFPRHLKEIQAIIERYYSSNMPGECSPRTLDHLCKTSITPWQGPLETLVSSVVSAMRELVLKSFEEVMELYKKTQLYLQGHGKLETEFLAGLEKQLRKETTRAYSMETRSRITVNSAYEQNAMQRKNNLLRRRRAMRVTAYGTIEKEHAAQNKNDTPKKADTTKKTEPSDEQLDQRLGVELKEEIGVLARVQAYYQVAADRFVDQIHLFVATEFFENAAESIGEYLGRELNLFGANGHNQCRSLMEPDSEISKQRNRRQQDLKKLNQAMSDLRHAMDDISEPDEIIGSQQDRVEEQEDEDEATMYDD